METFIQILVIGVLITFAVFLLISLFKMLLLLVPLLILGVAIYFIIINFFKGA